MNLAPIGCLARLVAARARRRPSPELQLQARCVGRCSHVPVEVWAALDRAYPDFPLEGPGHRQDLAGLIAPLMAEQGWRFCACYLGRMPEHRFFARLIDTAAANREADACAARGGRR